MTERLNAKQKDRIKVIKHVLNEDVIDMTALRRLAAAGLVNGEARSRAWPRLLGLHPYRDMKVYADVHAGRVPVPRCRDADQVEKDVARSLWHIVPPTDLKRRRKQLSRLLNWALSTDPCLHYYQGLHDVAALFLVHVGEELAAPLLLRVMTHHLREFLHERIDGVIELLRLMPPLLMAEDPVLGHFLVDADLGERCHFALSWVLTWFAHPLDRHFDLTLRLFDFFLATHPLMPMYLSVAVVLHRREAVLQGRCSFPEVHTMLTKFPAGLPWDRLTGQAVALYRKYAPAVVVRMAGATFQAPCLLLSYPFPYVAEPQHSERYWLLKATPEEKSACFLPCCGVNAGALGLASPGRGFAFSKPGTAAHLYRVYALAVVVSLVGCALVAGLGRRTGGLHLSTSYIYP
eukprot:GGOE01042845.1.p1 GENE.GGOE01042845.1~~GGOE01042845.1.p1  ORF type:complete len:404 (+),score=79.05 GGOE01042845.1:111-1322(+)